MPRFFTVPLNRVHNSCFCSATMHFFIHDMWGDSTWPLWIFFLPHTNEVLMRYPMIVLSFVIYRLFYFSESNVFRCVSVTMRKFYHIWEHVLLSGWNAFCGQIPYQRTTIRKENFRAGMVIRASFILCCSFFRRYFLYHKSKTVSSKVWLFSNNNFLVEAFLWSLANFLIVCGFDNYVAEPDCAFTLGLILEPVIFIPGCLLNHSLRRLLWPKVSVFYWRAVQSVPDSGIHL